MTMLCTDPLWWLCYVSVLQPSRACTPSSQHLHLFVKGLPSVCRRPAFSACTESRQCLWIYIPPDSTFNQWLTSIDTPAPSPWWDSLCYDPLVSKLLYRIVTVTSVRLCLASHFCLYYFLSLSHVPTTPVSPHPLRRCFLSRKSCDNKMNCYHACLTT